MPGIHETGFREVLNEEMDKIHERRSVIHPHEEPTLAEKISTSPANRPALTGLALSGGGIRAACIGLGVLQSLYRRGILRQIDYISTVSGSGYIGSYLSSWLASEKKEINWHPDQQGNSEEQSDGGSRVVLPFHCEQDAPQPVEIQKLANRGEVMNRPIQFLSRHLGGLLAINAFLISGLVALGAVLAWMFRTLDHKNVSIYLNVLGFSGDIARAFFPAAVMLAVWIFCCCLMRYFQKRRITSPQFGAAAYLALIVSVALGFVSTLSLKNADSSEFLKSIGFSVQSSTTIQEILNWVTKALMVLFSVAILPSLNLKALIRSGTNPRNPRDTFIFNLVSRALIAGVPLLIFGFLSVENISGWNEQRELPFTMARGHIRDWEGFWNRVKARKGSNDSVASKLITSVDPKVLEEFLKLNNIRDERNRELWFWDRWLAFAGQILRFGDRFEVELRNEHAHVALRERIVASMNEQVLSDPEFIDCIEEQEVLKVLSADNADNADNKNAAILKSSLQRLQLTQNEFRRVSSDLPQRLFLDFVASIFTNQAPLGILSQISPTVSIPPANTAWNDHLTLSEEFRREKAKRSTITYLNLDNFDSQLGERETKLNEIRRKLSNLQRANWEVLMLHFASETYKPEESDADKGIPTNTDVLYNWKEVFSAVVLDHDQEFRLKIASIAALAFLVIGSAFSINPTTLHGFYRDQLSELWLVKHRDFGMFLPLRELQNSKKGAPIHLIHGTLNLFGRMRNLEKDTAARFTFSESHVGCERTGYCKSDQYMGGKYSLADAMAISGAAVSPTAVNNVLVRWLLVLFNFRLGQWLHHPTKPPGELSYPSALRLAYEQWTKPPEQRAYQFVTDGGHDENTGISALLQRRCRVIIACDSGQDGTYEFADLRRLMSEGLDKFGVRFQAVDPSKEFQMYPADEEILQRLASEVLESSESKDHTSKSKKRGYSSSHFVVYRIQYPDDELSQSATLKESCENNSKNVGWMIYIKSSLTKNEPEELRRFPGQNPEFPHDATLDQFFDPNRFMRYRQLGECLAEDVYQQCFADSYWRDMEQNDPFWLANQWPNKKLPPEVCNDAEGMKAGGQKLLPILEGPLRDNLEKVFQCLESESVDAIEIACVYLTCLDDPISDRDAKARICDLLKSQYDKPTADVDLKMFLCNAFSMIAEPNAVLELVRENLRDAKQPEELRLHLLELWRDVKTNSGWSKRQKNKTAS